MQIVVLAGGLATRMLPETEQIPKSLLLVNGRPFVDWQLDRFAASGARSVVMCSRAPNTLFRRSCSMS